MLPIPRAAQGQVWWPQLLLALRPTESPVWAEERLQSLWLKRARWAAATPRCGAWKSGNAGQPRFPAT